MYGALWRRLPGPLAVRLVTALVLFGGVLALLWFVLFPVMERRLPFNDVTVNTPAGSSTAP